MTIGNIDKATRRKPSDHAWILVAYLPTHKLDELGFTTLEAKIARAHLFHACMREIVKPLIKAGKDGIHLTGGDGAIRHCHPILAIYSADYPEQCLVACSRNGAVCPVCGADEDEFGNHVCYLPRDAAATLKKIRCARQKPTLNQADLKLKRSGLNFIDEPFWAELPFFNIHNALAPDVLHQGYQGVLRTLVGWLKTVVTPSEVDARFARLPPMHGIRGFKQGISHLNRVTGREHKEICKQILGCIIGKAPTSVIRSTVAILDFFYIAQYQSHTEATLKYMEDALDVFHENKEIFIQLGARKLKSGGMYMHLYHVSSLMPLLDENFNIPKIHALEHYVDFIRRFGTTDNYNTEHSERLHIDLVKDAYRATNHRDVLKQMVQWLSRRESVLTFETRVQWLTGIHKKPPKICRPRPRLQLAKMPTVCGVGFPAVEQQYGASNFRSALKTFVAQYRAGGDPRYRSRRSDRQVDLPFEYVDIWHRMKFNIPSIQSDNAPDTHEIADATPSRQGGFNAREGRFDTVLVNDTGAADVGIEGKQIRYICSRL